jgi:hypothetical protein
LSIHPQQSNMLLDMGVCDKEKAKYQLRRKKDSFWNSPREFKGTVQRKLRWVKSGINR